MRSPEFRKHSGFIKRKATNDSHNSSEEQMSSYRYYERPMNNPHKYVYPSLARDYSRASPYMNQQRRLSPEDDKSSSDFDQFEMNSSLSSQFRKVENKQKPAPTDSSFSLSPYENSLSSDEEVPPPKESVRKLGSANITREPIRQQISEQQRSVDIESKPKHVSTEKHRLLRSHKKESSKKKRSRSASSASEGQSDNRQTNNRAHDQRYRGGEAIYQNRFEQKQISGKRKQVLKNQASQSSSSSFSLDSDSPKKQTSQVKRKNTEPRKNPDNKLQKIPSTFSNSKKPVIDKTATFNKPDTGVKPTQIEKPISNLDESKISSQKEELITQYNLKEFKGGSMKDRVLNNYYNIQKQKQKEKGKSINKQQSSKTNQFDNPPPKPSQSPAHKLQPKQSKLLKQQRNSPESGGESPHKAEAFEIDVKVKNMTLAEAFSIRCGKLKHKLQQERQEFKRGHYAKIYKQQMQQHENYQNQQNIENKHVKKSVNKNMQRTTVGARQSISKKDTHKLTKKKHKQLPEVKHRMNEEKKRQDLARRMQNVKKLDREVRLKLKYSGKH